MKNLIRHPYLFLLIASAIYITCLSFPPIGFYLIYPFILSGTIFHEFGHAIGAIITDGQVHHLQINANTSGVTTTSGGIRSIVIMGGYIGSIIFGNILLFVGYVSSRMFANLFLKGIAIVFFICSFVWFSNITSFAITGIFAASLYYISKTKFSKLIIMTIGALMVVHIIQDFNGGPSSDLNAYHKLWPMLSPAAWSIVWLLIAIAITYLNMRFLNSHYRSKYMSQMNIGGGPNPRYYEDFEKSGQ